jgi:ketosteroid isomerase-like protein
VSHENLEKVRQSFRRFRSGDAGWTDDFHPDIEWDFSDYPMPDAPDTGRGREQLMNEVLATFFTGWLDYTADIRELIDVEDDVVVVLHETARLRDSDTVLDREYVQVWTVRKGLFVRFRVFRTREAALVAVGLSA